MPPATFVVFLTAFLLNVSPAPLQSSSRQGTLLDSVLEIGSSHESLCGSALAANEVRSRVAALADQVRARIDSEREKGTPSADAIVRSTNEIIFGPHGLKSSADLHDPCNLLVSGVLTRGRGYCVGLAAVYLSVAEELGLPIRAVATPAHVFLRYDDGTTRINIETFNAGASIPDAQYIAQQRIAPESIEKGVFLAPLSTERFLAQIHNNFGVIDSERRDFERAGAEYERALRLDRRLPAAWYNLGKDQAAQKQFKSALRSFSKALRLNPNDTWALNNRGRTYQELGDLDKARADYEAALRLDPAFTQARANLAALEAVKDK